MEALPCLWLEQRTQGGLENTAGGDLGGEPFTEEESPSNALGVRRVGLGRGEAIANKGGL